MPLDVQPLSPHRQATMLLLLLGLLGAALGFAQILVASHAEKAPPPQMLWRTTCIIRGPAGFVESEPRYASLDGAVLSARGNVQGQDRSFVVLSYLSDISPDEAVNEATGIFKEVMGSDSTVPIPARGAVLGGQPAIALEGQYRIKGEASQEAFLMERLTLVEGKVVAICYSGRGVLTDSDRKFFKGFCETGVVIRSMETHGTDSQ